MREDKFRRVDERRKKRGRKKDEEEEEEEQAAIKINFTVSIKNCFLGVVKPVFWKEEEEGEEKHLVGLGKAFCQSTKPLHSLN